MLERKMNGGEVVDEGDVTRRTSFLFEGLSRLVQGAMEIVRRTFFELVLRWYLSELVPDADEATRKVRDFVLQYCRVALRFTYLLQDLYSFIVTGRDRKEVAGLLKAELELLASEVDEAFIVAASRINEFERLFEDVGILDASKRLLADAVREWEKIKEENLPTLYSALAEHEREDAVSSVNACRRFVLKFVGLFDPLRITRGDEESIKFLKRIDEVGEFIFDAFWMATIAGYHVARGIKVLVSDFQGEKEAYEVMKGILERKEARWQLSEVDVERVAFSLIRIRHEIEDALSAAEKAIEMAEKAESSISNSDVDVKLKVRDARSRLEKWRSETSNVLENVLELQRFIEEKKVLPRKRL
ncbi:MAG: hypothetical protein QXN15_05990 [Candidatus Jordarchaeales archaeon]